MPANLGLSDAQARNLVIKSLRNARASYRAADTAGEKLERELNRLIKRKTRINANSLANLANYYTDYNQKVDRVQDLLTDAYNATANF